MIFEFVHDKVVNVDATHENEKMGLSLQFYFCQIVKHDWVIHVDNDMKFDTDTISELLIEFSKNTKRIVGQFGRDLARQGLFVSMDTHLVIPTNKVK